MKTKIIPIFVPHQGCPHDCIFCNQKKITGVSTSMTADKTRKTIEEALKTIDKKAKIEIAFFGGSFTAIDSKIQKELLTVANEYKQKGIVNDIRMSTRPDCIDEDSIELVKSLGTTIIELGVQSMDKDVLIDSLRGHDNNIVNKSAKLIKKNGIKLGLQMMVGLPSDSEEKCIETAMKFVDMKPDFVRIYPTIIIKETGLEIAYINGLYKPFELKECVDIVKKLVVIFEKNNIDIIRVGLQSTDDIKVGVDIVDGPYHPAFRELVNSAMIRDYLELTIDKYFNTTNNLDLKKQIKKIITFKDLIVHTSNKNISAVVGNKGANREFFNKKYGCRFKTKVLEEKFRKNYNSNSPEKNLNIGNYDNRMKIEVDGIIISDITFENMFDVLYEMYGLSNRKEQGCI